MNLSPAADQLNTRRPELAAALVEREFSRHPDLITRYGPTGRAKSEQDAGYHLAYLAQALAMDNRALFIDYVGWAKVMLAQRQVRAADLAFHLECLAEILVEILPTPAGPAAAEFVRAALAAMPDQPDDLPTFLHEGAPLSPLAHQYLEALRRGERQLASRLILDAVDQGTPIKEIYLHVFQASQYEIGRLWQTNRLSVAQEHYCTAATQLIMSQLYPHIFAQEKKSRTLVATCVAGDLHEMGVRMVADFFEMDGWDTFYLGANTPLNDVITTLHDRQAHALAISATISYHIDAVRDLIQAVRRDAALRHVKILVGGYPFNLDPSLAPKLGADGSAHDAEAAIALANQLTAGGRP